MKKEKILQLFVAFALIGATSGVLLRLKTNQRLGQPGIKTRPVLGKPNLEIFLPERAGNYESKLIETSREVIDALPKDTSFAQRIYHAPDGFEVVVNVVLMGSDRTSLHKPQFCLRGIGWDIDEVQSSRTSVRMDRPQAYNLPVTKLIATKTAIIEGQPVTARGVYVYWFVAENKLTADHWQRMWWMAKDLLRTGLLERWAYITYFAACAPGNEGQTFGRMKELMAASVPEFQLVPRPTEESVPDNARSK